MTSPLSTGVLHNISWYWDEDTGGELVVDGVSSGEFSPGFPLKDSASDSIRIGEVMYNGGGRQHPAFVGTVSNITVIEHDIGMYDPGRSSYTLLDLPDDAYSAEKGNVTADNRTANLSAAARIAR